MKYLGGKGRIAGRLLDAILLYVQNPGRWIEPFVGGGWTLEAAHRTGRFTSYHAGDVLPDLILLYQAVAAGWDPPTATTREQHAALRHAEPSALRGLVGFGSSFAGEWFAGFCGDKINSHSSKTNAELAAGHLNRRRGILQRTAWRVADYRDWAADICPGDVVYCDPPYEGTRPYPDRPKFDSADFWQWCFAIAGSGAHVFVSEYADAPAGADLVWERTGRQNAGRHGNAVKSERLYYIEASIHMRSPEEDR